MHTLLKTLRFKSLLCALLLAASLQPNSAQAATATASPQGDTTDVRQVVVRFDADMVELGAKGTAPATLSCNGKLPGVQGRWIDTRTWGWEFSSDLPPLLACDAALRQGVKTLAGELLTGARLWKFTTGGPRIISTYPAEGSEITEQQPFLLRSNVPLEAQPLREHVRCEPRAVKDATQTSMPVAVLSNEEMLRELEKYRGAIDKDEALYWSLLRCEGVLPNSTPVRLLISKGMQARGVPSNSNRALSFRVRPVFTATVRCGQLSGAAQQGPDEKGCDPRQAVSVVFSVLVSGTTDIKLLLGDGRDSGTTLNDKTITWRTQFVFNPPFVEGATYQIELPKGIEDTYGRTLVSNTPATTFPQRFKMAILPTYVGMLRNLATVPFTAAGSVVPLAVRRAERNVPVQTWRIAGTERDADVAAIAAWQSVNRDPHTASRVALDNAWKKSAVVSVSTASGAMEFVGIKLAEPGLVLLKAQSPAYDAMLAQLDVQQSPAPPQTSALVQVTNLNPTLRLGLAGQSAVWVTALDSGLPVPQAAVALYSCNRELLWEGKTDAQGLAMLPAEISASFKCSPKLPASATNALTASRGFMPFNEPLTWLVVRNGADMALLPGGATGYERYSSPSHAPSRAVHTILDRTLFKAGDVVNMQHLHRLLTASGFALPAPSNGRVEIRFNYADKVADLPITWSADGAATSSWQIPASAKLGNYSVTVFGEEGFLAQTSFQVEEFRVPVFDATITGRAQWLGEGASSQQSVKHQLSLAFMAGGAAAGQAVTLISRYSEDVSAPRPGFDFGSMATRLRNRSLPAAPKPQTLILDAQGAATIATPVPALDTPFTLLTELQFSDPNGEVQTVGSSASVWPGRIKLGLRVVPPALGKPSQIEVLALGDKDQAVAKQAIKLTVQPVVLSWGGAGQQVTPNGKPIELCSGQPTSVGNGLLICDWPLDGVAISAVQNWLVSASTTDSAGKVVLTELLETREPSDARKPSNRIAQNQGELQLANGFSYKGGSVAQVLVRPARLPAQLLLTVEREGVLAASVHTITSDNQAVPLPINSLYAPNVLLVARYVYSNAAAVVDAAAVLPLSTEERINISVDPEVFRLKVSVQPALAEARPRAQVPLVVQLSRESGVAVPAGARITLVAVDEALLTLKPNDTWRMLGTMFRQRSSSILGSALDALLWRDIKLGANFAYIPPEEMRRMRQGEVSPMPAMAMAAPAPAYRLRSSADGAVRLAKGEGGLASSTPPRSDFSPLILWRTDLIADANGRATAVLPLNDSLTRVRIVALVTSGADLFGVGEATLRTTQPLQLFSGLPPQLRSGDVLTQKVTLRNTGSAALSVSFTAQATLTGSAEAPARILPSSALAPRGLAYSTTVVLAAGASADVQWPLAVPDNASALRWNITAQGRHSDGNQSSQTLETDALTIEQVINPLVSVSVRNSALVSVAGELKVPIAQPAGALPQQGGVRVRLQASLVEAALAESKLWMASYPYACFEQQTSRFVALNDRAGWDGLMEQLPRYMDSKGLVRYFPESSLPGSETLTAYLLDVAHSSGWPVPEEQRKAMLVGLLGVLEGRLAEQDWSPERYVLERQIALQAVLAVYDVKAKEVQPPDLNRLSANSLIDWLRYLLTRPVTDNTKAQIAAAAGQLRSRYDMQGTALRWRNERQEDWWWFMWSGDTAAARAALLAQQLALTDASWGQDAPRIINGLVGRQAQGRWSTTTGNVWATLALRKFASQMERGPVSGSTSIALAGKSATVDWTTATPPATLLPWPQQGARDVVSIKHQGTGAPWATVSVLAAVQTDKPIYNGLRVQRSISPVRQRVVGKWSVGDVYRIKLNMESTAPQTWVVVADAVPSGATILGRGLGRESNLAQAGQTDSGWAWPSYVERAQAGYRAYFRWVPRGNWSVEYTVRINNAGDFKLPPVRIEAMYAPEVFGEAPVPGLTVLP